MSVTRFHQTPGDRTFVDVVERFIRGARDEIEVIAGELSAYNIQELKTAIHDAAARGVKITIYANGPDEEVASAIRSFKPRLKIAPLKSRHHYLVVDGRNVVVSQKQPNAGPTRLGDREGLVYENEPEMAEAVKAYQTFLDDAATGVEPREVLRDLLRASLRHPQLAREIPIAENVLVLSGLEASEARRYVERLDRQVRTWTEGQVPAGFDAAPLVQTVVNGAAMLVAQAAVGGFDDPRVGRGVGSVWDRLLADDADST